MYCVRRRGLEPRTCCLEGSRSIRLSYRRLVPDRALGFPADCLGFPGPLRAAPDLFHPRPVTGVVAGAAPHQVVGATGPAEHSRHDALRELVGRQGLEP